MCFCNKGAGLVSVDGKKFATSASRDPRAQSPAVCRREFTEGAGFAESLVLDLLLADGTAVTPEATEARAPISPEA